MYAVGEGHSAVVEQLVAAGAEVNVRDEDRRDGADGGRGRVRQPP